jgi:hypothetical protein
MSHSYLPLRTALLALCCALAACGDDGGGGSASPSDLGGDDADASVAPDLSDSDGGGDPDAVVLPDLTTEPDALTEELLDRLSDDSLEPPCVRMRDGIIRTLDVRIPSSVLGGGSDPVSLARAFAARYDRDLGLTDGTRDLEFRTPQREGELRIVSARRLVDGVPVFGAQLRFVFQLDAEDLVLSNVFAALPAAPALETTSPATSESAARAAAVAATELADPVSLASELVYFDPALLGRASASDLARGPHLAWRVLVEGAGPPFAVDVFVDARDASVARILPATSAARLTYTADGDVFPNRLTGGPAQGDGLPNTGTGFLWFLDGARISRQVGEPAHDEEGIAVDLELARALAWLEATFGAPAWDRVRGDLHAYCHFDAPGAGHAFWHPHLQALFVSEGFLSADVATHELGHAVLLAGADFVRWGEAAALDESFADVLTFLRSGDTVLRHGGCPTPTDPACVLRDLEGDELASHLTEGPRPFDLAESPHYNGGISTRAALSLLDARDADAVAATWWRGHVAYLTPSATFIDTRWQLYRACTDLSRVAAGERAEMADCSALLAAFAAVGVGGPGSPPGDARICAP